MAPHCQAVSCTTCFGSAEGLLCARRTWVTLHSCALVWVGSMFRVTVVLAALSAATALQATVRMAPVAASVCADSVKQYAVSGASAS